MIHFRAFTLIDSLLALSILLGAGLGMARLSQQSLKFWQVQKEQAVAREILAQIRFLPISRLETFGTQYFDLRGQPPVGGRPHFTLTVKREILEKSTWWVAKLSYTDRLGQFRELIFRRRA
ncbi:MAG: type II secretion system protein [Acidobacteriota bacterium]|nr:type II secretion system protein [Acidobacteriota bacterium]